MGGAIWAAVQPFPNPKKRETRKKKENAPSRGERRPRLQDLAQIEPPVHAHIDVSPFHVSLSQKKGRAIDGGRKEKEERVCARSFIAPLPET